MDEVNLQTESNSAKSTQTSDPTTSLPVGPTINVNGSVSKDLIIAALKNCYDPEVPVNIYDLGLIYTVDVGSSNDVAIQMTLTAPNCPAAQFLPADVRHKVEVVEGVNSVEVAVTFEPPWTPDHMNEAAKLTLNIL